MAHRPVIILFVFLMAIGLGLVAPSQGDCASWFQLATPPQQAFRHQDIFVLNPTTCWVVSGIGSIFKTTDGGGAWQFLPALPAYLRCVGFADSLHGWIGTLTPDALLYETKNGGSTWALVDNLPEPMPRGICGMCVVNPSVVYGCGVYYGPPRVIKTSDGGGTWNVFDLSAYATTLIDCYFVSPDTGFVVGGLGAFPDSTRGVVIGTTDGGASWQTRFLGIPPGEWGWKISFPTRAVGYVSLQRDTAPVAFLKTTDGGVSWARKPFLSTAYGAQGIGFATETVGWIGGQGVLYGTTDGGDNWHQETWGGNLNRFRFVSDSLGYAVGHWVYKYDVNKPTFVPAGPVVSDFPGTPPMESIASSNDAMLYQNSPNPFRSQTGVEFVLEAPGFVNLTVYDLLGRHIVTLVRAEMSAGPHEARWDGKDASGREMASGAYVYRLEMAGHNDAKRMVLMR